MSVNIGDALSTGADKLTTTAGIQLGILYVALQLITALGANSAISSVDTAAGTTAPALSLPIGVAGGAVLATLGGLLNIALTIVVFRTVAHDTAELGAIPDGVTDDMLKTGVFIVIAGIIQGILVALGFILLIIPGLFILVSLLFTQVYITIEGEGPLEALSSSWKLAKGNRFPLFGLGVILFVISLLASIPTTIVSLASPVAGMLLNYVVSGFVSIFTTAVLVAAYQQLSGGASAEPEESTDGVEHIDDDSGFDYA